MDDEFGPADVATAAHPVVDLREPDHSDPEDLFEPTEGFGPDPFEHLDDAERLEVLEIDPKLQDRRAAVFLRKRRRTLEITAAALAIVLVPLLGYGLAQSPLFSVRTFEVIGIDGLESDPVVAASGLESGTAMLDVDPDHAAEEIESLSWVERASVSRRWPSTVEIRVTPVTYAAVLAAPSGQMSHIAIGGSVVHTELAATEGLVVVSAPEAFSDLAVGEVLPPELAKTLDAVAALPKMVTDDLIGAEVDEDFRLSLELSGGRAVYFGDGEDAKLKNDQLITVLGGKIDPEGICSVDVEVTAAVKARRYPQCG